MARKHPYQTKKPLAPVAAFERLVAASHAMRDAHAVFQREYDTVVAISRELYPDYPHARVAGLLGLWPGRVCMFVAGEAAAPVDLLVRIHETALAVAQQNETLAPPPPKTPKPKPTVPTVRSDLVARYREAP